MGEVVTERKLAWKERDAKHARRQEATFLQLHTRRLTKVGSEMDSSPGSVDTGIVLLWPRSAEHQGVLTDACDEK